MATVFLSVVCVSVLGAAFSTCPHTIPGLRRWSHTSSWPGNRKPERDAKVVISDHILLDESPPELHSITIESRGRLVWSPDGDYNVTTKYILIKGQMDIGSEDCKFPARAHITLTGVRGTYKVTIGEHLFGEKFIGVAPGGTLELHGQEKLPWTKLTNTLPKLDVNHGLMYDHLTSKHKDDGSWKDGINAYIFDGKTGNFITFAAYYLGEYDKYHYKSDPTALASLINSTADGNVVMLAVKTNLVEPRVDLKPVYEATETLTQGRVTGSGLIRTVKKGDAYAMVIEKGKQDTLDEHVGVNYHLESQAAAASMTSWDNKLKFSVRSYVNNKHEYSDRVNFRVMTTAAAYPILDVIDDVTSWRPGDHIFITSTDYLWGQLETAIVRNCTTCHRNQVQIDLEAAYMHWGDMIDGVDERAEIGLLTRNILIQGRMENTCPPSNGNCDKFSYDTFGGHLEFVRGYKNVHIEGVELTRMGQQTEKGFYPIHFHMCHDIDKIGGYSDPAWIRQNSIHHSFSRCVTVHGSHGATVQDNVAYDHLGHCYFLEDGGEKRTVFDGNLGAATKHGSILPSDIENPATFWMTSPLVYLRNNVAAGGDGIGIWYVFPEEPQGPSYGLGFLQRDEARHTALLEFNNNVGHSNTHYGLFVDNKINPDDTTSSDNEYDPREQPLNRSSAQKEVLFYRFTGYKNRYQNGWIRGGLILMDHSSFADSGRGMTFANSIPSQTLTNSIIIGESRNLGDPTRHWDGHTWVYMPRSVPHEYDTHQPFVGFMIYDGPVHLKNVWFSGFKENINYTSGAIGFLRKDYYSINPTNTVMNAKFDFVDGHSTGNRVYDGNETVHGFGNADGDKTSAFRDLDGSVTGYPGSTVLKPGPFFHNARCYRRDNWNMEICPQRFGMLNLRLISTEDEDKSHPFAVRDDNPSARMDETWHASAGFPVTLGGDHSYTIHWNGKVPRAFELKGEGVEKGDWVRFGICFPRNGKFHFTMYYPVFRDDTGWVGHHWKQMSSVEELDRDTSGGAVYHDNTTGLWFFKYMNMKDRMENETESCPVRCPSIRFEVKSGDMNDGDCTSRAYGPYKRAPITGNNGLHASSLQVTSKDPPHGWGAGPTRPFETRTPPNGESGKWTSWSQCSQSCGGGLQTRTRSCNSVGSTEDCQRHHVEYRACNTAFCTSRLLG
ncbi:cell surface hyaluronidase-like [Haliotis rufescens]|uniref:cell surface hyaluronidase-like n=1 Tax=Haliotis rufescens TaxID=6454 RepID=UPI00201F8F71|nr:cell surface hyaluronidase-like [Haliotis rufescens]